MTTVMNGTPKTLLQKVILLGGCCALLAGCSSLGLSGPPPKTASGKACPKVGFLRDAAQITQFREGKGRDLTDIIDRASLLDYKGQCTYDDTGVTVDFDLSVGTERGPAYHGPQPLQIPYFVAITAPGGDILAKREFRATVDFKNTSTTVSTESLEQHIPLATGKDGRGYTVLVGFQLTPEQLAYNRHTGNTGAH